MEILLFTKFFKECGAEEVGHSATELGVDGLDLALRAGQYVSPVEVWQKLPPALRLWREMGLSVPMVSLEGGHIDPHQKDVQEIYAACGETGIGFVKLGYWLWKPGDDYWQGVAGIRRALEGFQKLGEKHNICTLLHTHSDDLYYSNAAGAMHVAQGFNPGHIGIYLDPAHLAADGESALMAQAIAGDYFRMLGAKNLRYEKKTDGPGWYKNWCPLVADGLVDWKTLLPLMKGAGYNGPISFHAEYCGARDKESVLPIAARDMTYLRSVANNL